jgi:hypothetical protein
LSFWVISDWFDQNAWLFYTFQKTLVQYLCTKFPNLYKVMCLSDGSAAQYKKRTKSINIYL